MATAAWASFILFSSVVVDDVGRRLGTPAPVALPFFVAPPIDDTCRCQLGSLRVTKCNCMMTYVQQIYFK